MIRMKRETAAKALGDRAKIRVTLYVTRDAGCQTRFRHSEQTYVDDGHGRWASVHG